MKCLAQEHNGMFPGRVRTRTARSRSEHTNHDATVLPLNETPELVTVLTIVVYPILYLLNQADGNFYRNNLPFFDIRLYKISIL